MKIHSPSMSELHAFVTAVRLGSFAAAASHLCVTQSAISHSVARLEAHLGCKLFNRNTTELSLSGHGIEYLEAIEAPLAAIERASEALLESREIHSELVLSVVPTFSDMWLIPRLHDFQQRYPGIHLQFAPYRRDEDFAGKVPDVAILIGCASTHQWKKLDCTYVIGHAVVPVCHPDRLARMAWSSPAALAQEPLLAHAAATQRWQQWFEAVGVENTKLNVIATFDRVPTLLQAAIADQGIAITHLCLARNAIESGQLVIPFDLPIEQSRGYYLCAPPPRASLPSLKIFRQWLLEMAEQDQQKPFITQVQKKSPSHP